MATPQARQTAVNEVPLPEPFQRKLDTFLTDAVNYDAHENAMAFVIIFRPGENRTVNVNVSNWGLDEELEKKITDAIRQALNGVPLYTTWSDEDA